MMACEKSKILIIGATGYLGKYMLKASVSLGHLTYAYVRPIKPKTDSSKLLLHKEFEAMGATIVQGELDDHEKLVKAVEQVDVVISTVAVPQHLEQLKLIKAIKDAGNIKRFIPSEFGNEVDRVSGLPKTYSFRISYTVLNYEENVATYTIKAATDPRVANRVIVYRPQGNIVSQLDLISSWEKKTGCTFTRSYVPEEKILKLSETLPSPDNVRVSILHNIFIKGDQMSFELTENDLEASELYPDYNYTSIDSFLDICLVDPPKPKLAAFE
ncbi:PREDICTED: isoeugenol synthase 1-like [Prunus mume]|uniref:Isoeugenol synthase 1-like n=1 Tax=Prunus mume TaxID=102107 RepID=A0ABM0NNC4_PRUMU|nr:PREDICTED: isoeugenol synthase 1-like [Prunus mume]